MIEPLQSGEALLNDIHDTQPAPGEVAIWWLGQSGYAIKTASILFYIDLYLSEHLTAKYAQTEKPHIRMTRAPLRGDDLRAVEWVFSSHKHSDHLDPGTIPALFAHNPDARLILPLAIADHARSLGLERLQTTRGDEHFQVGAMNVHSIPAAHPTLDYSDDTGFPFLGYLFEVDGVKLYHSGDTLVYDGLAERLAQHQPDIVFLPINGTDERRNALHVPPNMNMDEALDLAESLGQPLFIPHHYDMFTFNTADINDFVAQATARQQPHQVLRCGERFLWSKSSSVNAAR
ncbi:MAG: MBL fold metallo-hydrolase [Anaerolineae bacterium]